MSSQAKAIPKPPVRRRERLDSLSNPQPRPPPQIRQNKPLKCPDPTCTCSGFTNEDDKIICETCGAVVQEYSMVTDVQYGVSSNGRNVVHGHHVGADQAYNRNGMLYDRNRQTNSEETTNLAGKRYMVQVSAALGVQQSLVDAGMQVFRLASANNFIQGRRTKSVAAVALYVACRTQRDNPNQHMLIDFSDILELNVFHLGHIYKGLINMLRINPNGHIIQPINPEDLILRFSQRLEFGDDTMRVANDAVRIVQRMNRDWMTPGRRPAGICGAALILAARMNNYRRTVRETVYVVKVQEQTIFKRLDEFKATESSGLTVEEFRTIDLERAADPPAFVESQNRKRKRRRIAQHLEFDDDGDNDQPNPRQSSTDPTSGGNANNQLPTPANTQQAQGDSQSMPPPPLPIDPRLIQVSAQSLSELTESSNKPPRRDESTEPDPTATAAKSAPRKKPGPKPKRKPGRPRKNAAASSSSAPATEAQLTSSLLDPLNIESSSLDTEASSSALAFPSTSTDGDLNTSQNTTTASYTARNPIPSSPNISPTEFDTDPEVQNCLLTPSEVAIKTRIWTHENHDWLRIQSAKQHKQQLAAEAGTLPTKKKRARRRGRIGDLRIYGVDVDGTGARGGDTDGAADGDDGGSGGQRALIAEGAPIAASAEEAVMRMLGVRAYSKKLNYDVLRGAYTPSTQSSAGTRRGSAAGASPSWGGAGSPGSGIDIGGGGRRDNNSTTTTTATAAEEATAVAAATSPSPSPPSKGKSVVRRTGADEAQTRAQQEEVDGLVGQLEEEGVYDDDDEEEEEEDEVVSEGDEDVEE